MNTITEKYGALVALFIQLSAIVWWASSINKVIENTTEELKQNRVAIQEIQTSVAKIEAQATYLSQRTADTQELLEYIIKDNASQ